MHNDGMMMAQWKVTYYTNLNTCAISPKPEISYVEIQIYALVTMKQNWNHLHWMDIAVITHNVHSVMCTQCTLHTEPQCKASTNTHEDNKEKNSFKHIEIKKVKWKTQVHWSFKSLESSWMCKGLVATCKLRVLSLELSLWKTYKTWFQSTTKCSTISHDSLLNGSLLKFQDELFSIMKTNGNANSKLLGLDGPCWKLPDPECTLHSVNSYKSLGMAKQNFDLTLRLWNWWITSLRFDNPCWSQVRVVWIVIFLQGGRVMWPIVVFIVTTFQKPSRGPFAKWGKGKK